MRAMAERPRLAQLRARMTELWELEIKLDEKLERATTWSGRWWHLLDQINIVRKQRIAIGGVPSIAQNPFVRLR